MLSLLSLNQAQRELKFLLNCFSMPLTSLSPNTRQESSPYRNKAGSPLGQNVEAGKIFEYDWLFGVLAVDNVDERKVESGPTFRGLTFVR